MIHKSDLLRIFNTLKNREGKSKAILRKTEYELYKTVNEMVLKYANDPNRSYRGFHTLKDDFIQRSFLNIIRNLHNIRIVPNLNRKFFATIEHLPLIDGKRCQIVDYNTNTQEFTVTWKYRKYTPVKVSNMKIKLLKSAYIVNKKLEEKRGLKLDPEIVGKLVKIVYRFKSTVVVLFNNKIYLLPPNALGFNNLHSYLTYIIDDSIKQV